MDHVQKDCQSHSMSLKRESFLTMFFVVLTSLKIKSFFGNNFCCFPCDELKRESFFMVVSFFFPCDEGSFDDVIV